MKWSALFGGVAAMLLSSAASAAPIPLHRGMNVLGYDPIWKDPSKARFQTRHFAEIRRGGFDFIRVNLAVFDHMDAQNRIDPAWLKRLDWVVREASKAGLSVILDEHDFNQCSENVEACRGKLGAVWSQLASRYSKAPRTVAFELLNEPHDAMNGPVWNSFIPPLMKIVRASNPTRTVVIGPTHWNSMADLALLELPEGDRNIVVTFHYYEPFRFTHQGASWTDMKTLSGVTWGDAADRERVREDMAKVAAWSKEHNRPILLGEFGAFDKSGTPMQLRAAYTNAVAREAERNGFGWAYWQFDSDFIAWDMTKNGWVEPIRKALIPEGGSR